MNTNEICGIIHLHLGLKNVSALMVEGILIFNLDYIKNKVA